jgi:hypothetical protein
MSSGKRVCTSFPRPRWLGLISAKNAPGAAVLTSAHGL